MEKKSHLFKAEISQMLDLVVNSLYSKKEIFLRELLSNASDAIDRAKYQGLTNADLIADNPAWTIGLIADKDAKTLTICDNGSGMDATELENNLGVIASSGTKAFTQALKDKGDAANLPELIGRFGVGFYAAFMVADKVTVISKKRGTDTAAEWVSDGAGSYTIGPAERAMYGTDIILHLREDQQEYLDEWRLRDLVKTYSDFIAYPIMFKELPEKTYEKEEDRKLAEENAAKPLNTMTALWKRAKKDVKPEEYVEFYKHLTHDYDEPLETIHFAGEGQVEFKALLFLPKSAGMDIYMPQTKRGLSLYVRNVFIGNDFEMLLPEYLRFAKGVVDSADLPLNVSREMLQDDVVIGKIKSAVTSKILSTLGEMKEKRADVYKNFWTAFGRILKEGVHTDYANADRIKKLLFYPSAKTEEGKLISLDDYIKAMPADQKDIYFLAAERLEEARHSPQIEQALKHGCDVLFFVDPVDEWLIDSFREYEGKKLVDVAKGDVQFGSESEQKAEKEANDKAAADLKPFLDAVKEQLKDSVADVRVSTRLADSPCCLVAGANALSASMERMLRAMKQDVPHEKRTLEVNAAHPLVQKMKGLSGEALSDAVELLYDQALIAEGSAIPDPGRFSKLLTALMLK